MDVLTGTGHGDRAVFARAAVLAAEGGRATLDDALLTEAARRQRRGDEPLDVVLVAADAAQALLLRLPGLMVVGVVAEQEAPYPLPDDVSVVTGAAAARDRVPEGEWVIVDPVRGRAIVQPDAPVVARLQAAEARPRVLLGAAHTPAQTQSGRPIAVWAVVREQHDLDAAISAGADGLVVPAGSEFLGASDPDAALPNLLFAAQAIGGGALGIRASIEQLDPVAAVTLAAHCQLHWLLDPAALPLEIAPFRAELLSLVQEEQEADRPARMPRLVAVLGRATEDGAESSSVTDLHAFDEVLLLAPDDPGSVPAAEIARNAGLPLRAWLDASEDADAGLSHALALGAAGVCVEPGEVATIKDRIRERE